MNSALNSGQVRSIRHFQRIFPEENIDDFIFEELDRTILFQNFGSWLSGYPVNCIDMTNDKEEYDWWCTKLGYAYKRKIPLKQYPTIRDELLFTSKMDVVWCSKGGYTRCDAPYFCKSCYRFRESQDYDFEISDSEEDEDENKEEDDENKDELNKDNENENKEDENENKDDEEKENEEQNKDENEQLTEYMKDLSMKDREYFLNRIELLEKLLIKNNIPVPEN